MSQNKVKVRACVSCDYFRMDAIAADRSGECRRHTPAVRADGIRHWPRVKREDWCGEYRTKTVSITPGPDDEQPLMEDRQ